MLRSEIPIISAACPHVILFAIARKITSCTLIARSQATSEYFGILPPTSRMPQLQAPLSGQITCYLNRTDDMLTTRDGSSLASPVRTVLTLQMEAWLPVTGGLNKCRGVATKKVTFVSVTT
jgi:hypothetical protein